VNSTWPLLAERFVGCNIADIQAFLPRARASCAQVEFLLS